MKRKPVSHKLFSVLRTTVKRIRPSIGSDSEDFVRWFAARSASRKLMNALYRNLTFAQMSVLHKYCAGIFREGHVQVDPGQWTIKFAGKRISLPLTRQRIWLDWETALSILGHEVEIKATYASLIRSSRRPELFIDIGTNYGTHSLLFLVHGIDSISFEPNKACHAYFKEACSLNHVRPNIQGFALGDTNGSAELCFPEKATWMGTTRASARAELESRFKLVTRTVEQRRLDDFRDSFANRRLLIKIDTEGNEHRVLLGAIETLREYRPPVIFESFIDSRAPLFDFFDELGYKLMPLPWSPEASTPCLERQEFIGSTSCNFIAIPAPGRQRGNDTVTA